MSAKIEAEQVELKRLEGMLPEAEQEYKAAVERLGSRKDEALELAAARARVRCDGLKSAIEKQRAKIAQLLTAEQEAAREAARLECQALYDELESGAFMALQTIAAWVDEWQGDTKAKYIKACGLAGSNGLDELQRKLSVFGDAQPYERLVAFMGGVRSAYLNPFYQAAGVNRKRDR